ncbi:MAG: hypothetical protein MI725_15850, partial [Pirellulales bacterium]|nr:hypothetical protein [Pirellulales bacterium]
MGNNPSSTQHQQQTGGKDLYPFHNILFSTFKNPEKQAFPGTGSNRQTKGGLVPLAATILAGANPATTG